MFAVRTYLSNVPVEDSWLGLKSCLKSLPNCARQSGWRLKFPGNLLTVPDMGRSQWSQIIRMFFSSPSKNARQRGRAPISINTSHATGHPTNKNANILKDPNEMDIEHAPKDRLRI